MAIVVRPIDRPFKVVISEGKEKVEFIFKQLDYKTKALITSLVTTVKQGQIQTDSQLQMFYNLKHALKDVKGIKGEDGKPYKLKFEDNKKLAITDMCVDELLATPLSDRLQFAAHRLSASTFPDKILHPIAGTEIEGIEVIPAHEIKGVKKK